MGVKSPEDHDSSKLNFISCQPCILFRLHISRFSEQVLQFNTDCVFFKCSPNMSVYFPGRVYYPECLVCSIKKEPHSSEKKITYNSSPFFIIYRKEIKSYSAEQGAPYMSEKYRKRRLKITAIPNHNIFSGYRTCPYACLADTRKIDKDDF